MGHRAQGGGVTALSVSLWSVDAPWPAWSRLAALLADQATKLWLLYVFDLARAGRFR